MQLEKYEQYQISSFDWLKKLDDYSLPEEHFSDDLIFEVNYSKMLPNGKILYGRIDCIDLTNKIVWEFKCVNNITIEGKDYPVIFDYNYNMGFNTSYDHPISLGSQSSQTFTSFYNKVAQKESTGTIKAKQVYELHVSDNYGITALTSSTGTKNPELVTTSFQK